MAHEYKIVKCCTALAIMTASFDIVGMVNIAGLNFRFTQFISLPVFLFFLLELIKNKKMQMPRGSWCLWIWVLIQIIFSLRSPDLKNAIGYDLWLIFSVLYILSSFYFIDRAYSKRWLLQIYLTSYVVMATIGLIQLMLYAVGINFFVVQFWTGRLARINGFSYEPSYYATYMLMGFVSYAGFLIQKNYSVYSKQKLKRRFFLVATALILSSSRMGWLMIGIFMGGWILKGIWKIVIEKKKGKKNWIIGCMVLLTICLLAGPFIGKNVDFSMFSAGLGINGGSTHSSGPRIDGLQTCLKIFEDSPIIGYGLGGVDPIICQYKGIKYSTTNNGMAMSIVGELLVANGLVGLFPLLAYIYTLLKYNKQTVGNVKILKMALLFELMILCFNQNILRSYVWWHIAVLSAIQKHGDTVERKEIK